MDVQGPQGHIVGPHPDSWHLQEESVLVCVGQERNTFLTSNHHVSPDRMRGYPHVTREVMLKRLEPPLGKVSVILDTDTYNEIDDQFALVYATLSENIHIEAIHAAPFYNERATGPADGMEKSYQEILRILQRLGYPHEGLVFRGSEGYLPDSERPVESPASANLIKHAMAKRDGPLYVVAIGTLTNVASAILLEPKIIDRIVLVWLGGHPLYWPSARDFNLDQDIPAAQIAFDCGVPLVHIPCKNVSEHLRTTACEIERYVKGRGVIGDYLNTIFVTEEGGRYAWSKVIWDMAAVAWLVNPEWVPTHICPSPILTSEGTWSFDPSRHPIRMAFDANRDAIFGDFFRKLKRMSEDRVR